ncbi:MAG: M3 family oligoendopeptidase [Burkholderiales bacterium]|nr:M3 family oligoendopeptidase [Phycisphaerae bacterium]
MVAQSHPGRKFVPAQFDVADWAQIEPLCTQLLEASIASPAELEAWLGRASELSSVVDEYGSRRYIDKSCHTDDTKIEQAFMHFVENIEPKLKPFYFELQKKYLASPHRSGLSDKRYAILTRKWQADVDVFRPENIPLETQITKLVTEYDKICGAMLVEFKGKQYTMQQLARFNEETDRTVREESFQVAAARRMQDKDKIETIFEQLLPLRQTIAANAGCDNYRTFMWKSLKRFDYTPDDCHKFADAIEKSIVPLVRELDRQRKSDMGLEKLRPWDLAVDPKNRPPLRPFAEADVDGLVTRTRQIFERMSPTLATDFETLRSNKNLDLESRKGKQPGGYQCCLEECGQPFIFMNAAGLQRDVETLLHEGGHAFHFLAAAANEPLTFLRSAPMEFCEVASMSMEALGSDHYDLIYDDPALAARAKRTYFEGVIRFFPWMATIDQFQHWIYTHPGHSAQERTSAWLATLERFSSIVDWTGYEQVRAASWQRQLHLFHVPFYYVEYGIAQIGALQLWMKAKEDTQRAIANYRSALKLGGTRPLPELFSAAGLRFDFSIQTIEPLIRAVGEELASLPA